MDDRPNNSLSRYLDSQNHFRSDLLPPDEYPSHSSWWLVAAGFFLVGVAGLVWGFWK